MTAGLIGTLRLSTMVGYDGEMSVTQRFTPLRCHRQSSGTVSFHGVSRRGEDG